MSRRMWWTLAVSALAVTALSFRLLRREKRAVHQPIQHNDPGDETDAGCPECGNLLHREGEDRRCWWCGFTLTADAAPCPVCLSTDTQVRQRDGAVWCRAEQRVRHPWAHRSPVIPANLVIP